MPASHKSPVGTATEPGILLIEEYDALAVAIGSALKKFAPHHQTRVVQTLAEAEFIGEKLRPELLILDFDPPHSGAIEFFNRMKSVHPNARVLVVAAGTSRDVIAQRAPGGALQFMEKPFELAEFGATVQALLGPWNSRGDSAERGTLRDLNMADLIPLECLARASVILKIQSAGNGLGLVHISDGQLYHAEAHGYTGPEALAEILGWPNARVREMAPRPDAQRTIHGPWAVAFLESLRQAMPKPVPEALKPQVRQAEAPPKNGKRIAVIDDTEMLRIFVEDTLITAGQDWQIITASSGSEGQKIVGEALPDLVLLDYSLPDFNGDEVCRRLLENTATAGIPVIMMSGHVAEMNTAASRFDNIVATIEKPFLSGALLSLVQTTLENGRRPFRKTKKTEKQTQPIVFEQTTEQPQPRETFGNGEHESAPAVMPAPPPVTPLPVAPPASPTPPIAPAPPVFDTPAAPLAAPFRTPAAQAQIAESGDNEVVLGVPLEVVSMEFNPSLRMGAIRARPSSPTVSLHVRSEQLRGAMPVETGFELGSADLDRSGRMETLRLVPTVRPIETVSARSSFEIGDVALLPSNSHGKVQLTPVAAAPMTLQLFATFEIATVELSKVFLVSRLILKPHGLKVRISLDSRPKDDAGALFEIAEVQLNGAAEIAEILLNPTQ